MTDFEATVLSDLNVLKAQMKELVGNGQPGRLTRIEGRISDHEQAMQRLKGAAGALGALLTLAHFAIDILFHRR